jgi:hypothetical protein
MTRNGSKPVSPKYPIFRTQWLVIVPLLVVLVFLEALPHFYHPVILKIRALKVISPGPIHRGAEVWVQMDYDKYRNASGQSTKLVVCGKHAFIVNKDPATNPPGLNQSRIHRIKIPEATPIGMCVIRVSYLYPDLSFRPLPEIAETAPFEVLR